MHLQMCGPQPPVSSSKPSARSPHTCPFNSTQSTHATPKNTQAIQLSLTSKSAAPDRRQLQRHHIKPSVLCKACSCGFKAAAASALSTITTRHTTEAENSMHLSLCKDRLSPQLFYSLLRILLQIITHTVPQQQRTGISLHAEHPKERTPQSGNHPPHCWRLEAANQCTHLHRTSKPNKLTKPSLKQTIRRPGSTPQSLVLS
jgi:hypothetical protein